MDSEKIYFEKYIEREQKKIQKVEKKQLKKYIVRKNRENGKHLQIVRNIEIQE